MKEIEHSAGPRQLTEISLAEQLKISDREIDYRKELFSINTDTTALLVGCKDVILEQIDSIVEEFYEKQKLIPAIELLIGDLETMNRLQASMKRYIVELFEGFYDREYVNNRLRIGKVHKRIGVPPKLYISAICLLEEILGRYITKDSNNQDCQHCKTKKSALHRLLMFDIQLVFDTYINALLSEVESANRQVTEYAESLELTVRQRTSELEQLSRKDMLTGLFNQRSFYELLRIELARAQRSQESLVLVYADLNKFKQLNDTKGHKAGDALLAHVGKAFISTLRQSDFPFRYGGDEFCIIMPNSSMQKAKEVFERVITAFDAGVTQGVTFSAGIAETGTQQYPDMDSFVKKADATMYKAKAISKKKKGHQIVLCEG